MSRLPSLVLVALLVVLESCSPYTSTTGAPSPDRRCSSAILTLGKPGDRQVERDQDGHGHAIELWCTSGILTSQWDLRVGPSKAGDGLQNGAGPDPPAQEALTIGGCFFDNGANVGPRIYRDPGGAFARVEWTNRSAFGAARTYRFSYDFHTKLVTITLTTPCGATVSKVVSPQASYAKMAALLPEPPSTACGAGMWRPAVAAP